MLTIVIQNGRGSEIVKIPEEQAPAFRAAIQEVRDELADRLSARYEFRREAPYTRAIIALASFAKGLNALVPESDKDFGPRAHLWPEET